MAAEKDLEIVDGKGKKNTRIIIIVTAAVVVAVVAGYFLFAGGKPATPAASQAATEETQNAAAYGDALYVPLPRPFVFNIPGTARDRMVQIKVQLLVRGTNNDTIAKRHIPLIESSLLKTFSSANADELATVAGRDALKNKALSDLQQSLISVVNTVVVEEVLFTQFVMQ
ncbi:flagellar basal body-associated protein FliL [Chromatiaceae bacterium AAb-1]|jgi:flagellar FliL protein|nr:flagellar basal body-associated protein FliL [Chromatiaceae bacterium AAb-1]